MVTYVFQIGEAPSLDVDASHHALAVLRELIGIVAAVDDVLTQVLLLLFD